VAAREQGRTLKATVDQLATEAVLTVKGGRKTQAGEHLRARAALQGRGLLAAWEDGSPALPDYLTRRLLADQVGLGLPRMPLPGTRHSHALACCVKGCRST